ncbi:MAG: TIGR03619 family F420-dependent LLM class oxidoreductase [SAR202 cluster bacterium]|nr:TIGR03619 family F420-dependent LLM class oxidoreductase [SAR202 cluster bacterium]
MQVGVNLLNFGPGASPDALLRWARLAESLGYHSVMVSDHVAVTPDVAGFYPETFHDPFALLAWLAGKTKRVTLGTTVIVLPHRHPILMARLAANIDHMSGGRLIFGVGAGWAKQEFAALGLDFSKRGRMTDEYIEAMKALWTGTGAVSYEGETVSFRDVSAIPAKQRPHPPVWVGGNTDAGMRRAVRHGDAWHPINFTRPWIRERAATLRRMADEVGRPAPLLCPRIQLHLTEGDRDGGDGRQMGVGSPAQVRGDLALLQELDSKHVTLDWYMSPDVEATRRHERGWAMFAALAEKALDLAGERVR